MIPVTDLRQGRTFQVNGTPYQVVKYTHTKMGRGGAIVHVSCRNLKTGGIDEKTFNSGAFVGEVATVKRKLKYLYPHGENLVFIDPKTYEQTEVSRKIPGMVVAFLKEGEEVSVLFQDLNSGKQDEAGTAYVPLLVEFPANVILTVQDAAPGVKGNSVAGMYKDAVLENGLKARVPLFIKAGDKVKIDTKTGEYVERVKTAS